MMEEGLAFQPKAQLIYRLIPFAMAKKYVYDGCTDIRSPIDRHIHKRKLRHKKPQQIYIDK